MFMQWQIEVDLLSIVSTVVMAFVAPVFLIMVNLAIRRYFKRLDEKDKANTEHIETIEAELKGLNSILAEVGAEMKMQAAYRTIDSEKINSLGKQIETLFNRTNRTNILVARICENLHIAHEKELTGE